MGKDDLLIEKYGAKRVLFEFAERGFETYSTGKDAEGTDIIISTKSGKHREIKVKTRVTKEGRNFDIPLSDLYNKENFFIACYFFKGDDVWIFPAEKFIELNELDSKEYTYARVTIDKNKKLLDEYLNNYNQLAQEEFLL
jgi:hypothetical protein